MTNSRRAFVLGSVGAAVLRPVPTDGFVEARGPDLYKADGRKLHLKGINLGNWFEPEGYMFGFKGGPQSAREIEAFFNELIGPDAAVEFWRRWRQAYITADDINLIARSGLNSVRIPLHYKFFEQGGEGFALLDRALEWCAAAGLWAILDLHCAPGGQTGTNIDDSWGYPWLFESEKAQEHTCQLWKRIAARYRNHSTVLGYDLLNEPLPHYPALRRLDSRLEPLYKRITAAIREVDPNHLIILGGAQWDGDFKVFGPPFDPKLVYELHKYWMPPTSESLKQYVAFRERYHVPIWLGESGENNDGWIRSFVEVLERSDIGWCFWPYKKLESTSCMVSVTKPAHWNEIVTFARMPGGTGAAEKRIAARPSLEVASAALEDLLKFIPLQKCRRNPGYFEALGLKT